ncbi:MAG: hypothetical protein COX70_03730 [Flavobacteriales bacterium CG_4_10_14_0_2_um_filter_32_8]|nr:MAG: hypothetical protein COX70_03730 [Flavobacteriales bacterium CG_4_10_14_0_2_um_filter_32_8]PJB14789.1 MAG: hypothetical protein CO118_06830 [Flavobacteriales bacterium CG_4_9_14_3_um_filter_32_8]
MIKALYLTIFLLLGVTIQTFAQSFRVESLFGPGLTVGVDYLFPSATDDSTNFTLTKYKVQFVKPLRTKLGVDLKDFDIKKADAKASQIFLATKFSVAQPNMSHNNYFENIYKGELEVTGITASIRNGIWVYAANLYAEESALSVQQSFTPNLRVYTAYVSVKNFKFIYFYGIGMVINQGKIYPLPIGGFRKKINNKLSGELIIPAHIKLAYKLNKKMSCDLAGYYSGINAIYREGSAFQKNDKTLNLRMLKTYLALNTNIAKHYKLKTEVGIAYSQEIDALSSDFSQDMSTAPYISLSFNYDFGNSIFGNFVNRTE